MQMTKPATRSTRRRQLATAVRPVLEGLEGRQLFAATLTVTNPFILPGSDQVAFNNIGDKNSQSPTNVVHSQQALTLKDTGTTALTISSLTLSGPFAFVTAPTLPIVIQPGANASVTIAFTQDTVPAHSVNETNYTDHTSGGAEIGGSLTINSDDAATPTRVVGLAGYYQTVSNNNEEPSLQTIINRLGGYQTNLGLSGNAVDFTQPDVAGTPTAKYYGSEVVASSWQAADPTSAVSVQQLDAFHTQGNTATLYWYDSTTQTSHRLFRSSAAQGQTILPASTDGGTAPLTASFTPGTTFGIRVDNEYSTDSINVANGNGAAAGHHFRFFPVVDHLGNAIPNTYFVAMDYAVAQAENFDFNDNVYVVSNIRPATLPGTPANLTATNAAQPVLSWTAVNYTPVGYNVYRSTSASGPFTKLTATPITTTTYTDTTAPASGADYYEVTAVDTGTSAEGAPATAVANAGPIAAPYTFGATSGVAQTFDPLANDTDATGTVVPGSVLISTAPTNGGTATVNPTTGSITYTPAASYTGTETLAYTVADSNGVRSSPGTVTFNVTPVAATSGGTTASGGTTGTPNPTSTATPTLNPFVGQTLVNVAVTLPVLTSVTNDAAFSTTASPVAIDGQPSHGTVVANADGTVTYTPSKSFVGGDSFTYKATSLTGVTSGDVTVDVNVGVAVGSTTTYKSLTFTDADKTVVTVALNRGLADVYFDGTGLYTIPTKGKVLTVSGGSSNGLHIRTITLTGTTAASTLSITGAGNGQVTFGGVTDAAALGTLNAKTSNLVTNGGSSLPVSGNATPAGYVNLAGVRSVSLRSATNATIDLGATGVAGTAVTFAGPVSATSLSSAAPITKLSAPSWLAATGTSPGPITAPAINTLAVPGEFDADLTLTGPVSAKPDLGTARTGAVNNGTWEIGGSARSITIASAGTNFGGVTAGGGINSFTVARGNLAADVSAGLIGNFRVAGQMSGNLHTNGSLGTVTVGSLIGSTVTVGVDPSVGLTTADAENIGNATLRSLRVTGKGATPVFSDSAVIAHGIVSVTTGQINATAGNPEGIVTTSLKSAVIGVNNGSVRLNAAALASNSALAGYLKGKGLTLGDATSFRIDIV